MAQYQGKFDLLLSILSIHTTQARNGHQPHLITVPHIPARHSAKVEAAGQGNINSIRINPVIHHHTGKIVSLHNIVLKASSTPMASKVLTALEPPICSLISRTNPTGVATVDIVATITTLRLIEGFLAPLHQHLLADMGQPVPEEVGEAIFRTCNGPLAV